jgi:hypothetical protein
MMIDWGKSEETREDLLQWRLYPPRMPRDHSMIRGETTASNRLSYDDVKFRQLLTIFTRLFTYEVRILRNATAPIREEYQERGARCETYASFPCHDCCPCAKRPFLPPTTRRSDIAKEVPISSPENLYIMTLPLIAS